MCRRDTDLVHDRESRLPYALCSDLYKVKVPSDHLVTELGPICHLPDAAGDEWIYYMTSANVRVGIS